MSSVTVVHWNPRRWDALGERGRRLHIGPRVDNFGDLLGPLVVRHILTARGIDPTAAVRRARLVAVGSILHLARQGDVVWGTGVNDKAHPGAYRFDTLDVRAVRGPLTREALARRGIAAPEVYGDPALLLPELLPQLREWSANKRFDVTVVPNLHDVAALGDDPRVLHPRSSVMTCLERIARSERVVGSSLHGGIVAESLGIPARFVASGEEPTTKYRDYHLGTGRGEPEFAGSVAEALDMGGSPALAWDHRPLLDAFPVDLWASAR